VGTTWSIAEPDLLTIIRARLLAAQSSGALDAMNQKFVATAQASANRPHPVGGISPAQTDREWSYDPTVTIAEDIRDAKGNLIAAKGQKFNPLTRIAWRMRLRLWTVTMPSRWLGRQAGRSRQAVDRVGRRLRRSSA